jgi:tetratricopeptide (TPR) repeat protein
MMLKLGFLLPAVVLALAIAGCSAQINQTAAQNALAAGRLDEAAADIQTALGHDPDNLQLKQLAADIFTRRGVQYYQKSAMIAAAEDFQRAVAYQPNYAMAWDYLGLIASQQNDWQHAIEYGSKGAGLEGKPDPSYVDFARKQLLKIQSGGIRPYLPPGQRPKLGQ